MKHLIKIAITGKIASGKSTVSEIIKKLGFPVFESDKEVNKLFREQAVKIKIKELFDDKIDNLIKKDGSINKAILGDYVFFKEEELKNLENVIHPLLNKEKLKFIDSNKNKKILFFDVPLLFEKRLFNEYDFIIYLHVKKKIQEERALKRKKMNKDKFEKILSTQNYNIKEFKEFISVKIDTSKDLDQIKKRLSSFIHKKVLS